MLKKIDKFTVSLMLLFVASFVFWFWFRPSNLYYQETFQMFVWDSGFFLDLLKEPSGLAEYMAEFMVQFYYYPAIGALMVSGCMVLLAWLTRLLCQEVSPGSGISLLWYVPMMMVWYALSDFNNSHTFLVAMVCFTALSISSIKLIKTGRPLCLCASVAIFPVGYFLFGVGAYMLLVLSVAYMIMRQKTPWVYPVAYIVVAALTMAVVFHFVMYPVSRLLYGLNYRKYQDPSVSVLVAIAVSSVLPMLRIPERFERNARLAKAQCVLGAAALVWIAVSFRSDRYKLVDYLKLERECKWKEIIADADKNPPENVFALNFVNVALGFEHRLTSEMFKYPQMNVQSLYPDLNNDMFSPLILAEALFRMGLNDFALHYYFESKTGTPTFRNSVFVFQRLAETYLIHGDDIVAMKYLLELRKTLFYRDKANEYISLIQQNAVNSYPLFAELKAKSLVHDGLQAENQLETVWEMMLKENPKNYEAFEFLMAYKMLNMDMDGVVESLRLASQLQYSQFPLHLQEVFCYLWYLRNNTTDGLPKQISPVVIENFKRNNISPNSFWHYYLRNKNTK